MEYNKLIGDVLNDIITQKDMTLTRLSEKTGFNQSYLSKIVGGKMPKLPVNTLEKIVKALGYKMSEFMACVEKKSVSQLQLNT